jgi:hypothetical protein
MIRPYTPYLEVIRWRRRFWVSLAVNLILAGLATWLWCTRP